MANLKDIICTGVIRCLNKIYASEFIGKLTGNADTATSATKATQDESGNNIKASYASSIFRFLTSNQSPTCASSYGYKTKEP